MKQRFEKRLITWPRAYWQLIVMVLFSLLAGSAPSAAEELARTEISSALSIGDYDKAVELANNDPTHYLHELLKLADARRLSHNAMWPTLLHYKRTWLGQMVSEVDGKDFFLSRRGKTDPDQELRATLAAFFSTRLVAPNELMPQCRFAARYEWLKQELAFDPARLPEQDCDKLRFFLETIDPVSLTVVFPTTHPNSPSSMFGHTLIRIDRPGQTDATRMLDYTINYAAEPDPGAGPIGYAVKGLAGGFPGRFRIVPYHIKLREYAQMENRDIWEYRLRLSPEKIQFILKHAWELTPTHFDYYFFTENCSYIVLAILDAGFPEDRLTDDFNLWVLPVDTIRSLISRGLVEKIDYYPSHYKLVKARMEMLQTDEVVLANAIAADGIQAHSGDAAAMGEAGYASALDLSFEYMRYNKIAKTKTIDTSLSKEERSILLRRSQIKIASSTPIVPRPSHSPEQGHKAQRLGIGYGITGGHEFFSLDWRGVYHDWLDPQNGYAENSALEFGRISLRIFPDGDRQRVRLENLHMLHIENLEPRDKLFQRPSWRLLTGIETVGKQSSDTAIGYVLKGGAGFSYRWDHLLTYALIETDAMVSDNLNKGHNIALGPTLGLLCSIGDQAKIHLASGYRERGYREYRPLGWIELGHSVAIGESLSIQLSAGRYNRFGVYSNEIAAGLKFY